MDTLPLLPKKRLDSISPLLNCLRFVDKTTDLISATGPSPLDPLTNNETSFLSLEEESFGTSGYSPQHLVEEKTKL